MRAAEDDRVDAGLLQRRRVLAHGGGRRLAERVVALDQRHEARAGDGDELARRRRARARAPRSGRSRRSPASRAARSGGCASPGRLRAPRARSRRRPGRRSSVWSSGSAAAVAELQATTTSFTPCASRKAPISRAKRRSSPSGRGPYGQPRAVAEVDEVLVRQRDQALVEHGEPADAGVEHADRPLVHARDSREAAVG